MSKPKIYELWYNDYDGGSSWQFTHPNNKLKAEFQQDCQDTLREFAGEYIEVYESWIDTDNLIEVIALNLPKKGYVPFCETFEHVSFGMGGSCILSPDDDDGSEDAIRKLLGEDLLKKAYDKNKKIEDRI